MSHPEETQSATCRALEALESLMAHLRSPRGCAWDRAQTFRSLIPYTIEEVYEVVEAVESNDPDGLREELGDLLFHVVFYSQMAHESGHFSLAEVISQVVEKMRGRHPHVFGDLKADTPAEVVVQWERLKHQEKGVPDAATAPSVFTGVSSRMPALLWALKLQQKMAKVGFDWPHVEGVIAQVRAEQEEFFAACQTRDAEAMEGEMGDLLFSIANLARHLHINPEAALRRSALKCRNRFQHMEEQLRAQNRSPAQTPVTELEALWQESKQQYP